MDVPSPRFSKSFGPPAKHCKLIDKCDYVVSPVFSYGSSRSRLVWSFLHRGHNKYTVFTLGVVNHAHFMGWTPWTSSSKTKKRKE